MVYVYISVSLYVCVLQKLYFLWIRFAELIRSIRSNRNTNLALVGPRKTSTLHRGCLLHCTGVSRYTAQGLPECTLFVYACSFGPKSDAWHLGRRHWRTPWETLMIRSFVLDLSRTHRKLVLARRAAPQGCCDGLNTLRGAPSQHLLA